MYQPPKLEKNWVTRETLAVPGGFPPGGPYPEIIIQSLLRRGLKNTDEVEQFLDPASYQLADPFDLPDLEKGLDRILLAVQRGQRIGVWGDFDVDGQTSTSILVSALRHLNADVFFHIPVRGPESHGIGLKPLQAFLNQGIEVILTCDTGVSAVDSIAYAQSVGIDVVVTDHHLLPEVLPPAYAIINPRRLQGTHPLATMPGAGTALKFAEALLARCKGFETTKSLYDLAALGCVADLAELKGETRFMVQSGLALLRSSPRPSLAALLEAAGIDYRQLTEDHIAYNLAPRLNAIGRLSDANPIVDFLLSSDPVKIAVTVNQIEGLNLRRKNLSDQVFQGAMAMIERDRGLLDHPFLLLQHPEWPAGIVGIVASRLVELYQRPVILLSSPPGEAARGSARSIEGVDISAAIAANKDQVLSFGGHPMAAGLSLLPEKIDAFARGMEKTILTMVDGEKPKPKLFIDAWIPLSSFDLDFVKSLDVLAPYGQGNPTLVFAAGELEVLTSAAVGKMAEHELVDVADPHGRVTRLIRWNGRNLPLPEGRFDLAFSARASNYRGEEQVQFEWLDYRQFHGDSQVTKNESRDRISHSDFRHSPSPLSDYQSLITTRSVITWKEGSDGYPVEGLTRNALAPSDSLVIWSTPPDITVLRRLITSSRPSHIYWFLIPPLQHQTKEFLLSLDSLLHLKMESGTHKFDLASLAAETAVTERICALGLQWLGGSGRIRIVERDQSMFTLEEKGELNSSQKTSAQVDLQRAFQEISSFTQYLNRVELDKLVSGIK